MHRRNLKKPRRSNCPSYHDFAEGIYDKVFGNYANHLDAIDRMVAMSTSMPPQSDDYYRQRQREIEQMPASHRHEAYELLLGFICNNLGQNASIYDEIAEHANKNSLE